MKKLTYKEHTKKWNRACELVSKYNEELIAQWRSVPWWKFWVSVPSFEEQRQIIFDNWAEFDKLPKPRMEFNFKFVVSRI